MLRIGFQRSDIELFITLLNNNRNSNVSSERFKWLYLDNPIGKARAWYVFDENIEKAVAFTCVLPRIVTIKGKDIICWNCGDFSVEKTHRTLGIALKLRRAATNAVDNHEVDALYAHPNDKMKVIHQKVGHICIGKMNRYVKIFETTQYVQRYVKNKYISGVISLLLNLAINFDKKFKYRYPSEYRFQLLSDQEFSAEYDLLFCSISKYFPIVGKRDSLYLNWRYFKNPLNSFERIEIRTNKGELVGYLIYNIQNSVAHLIDIFCKPDKDIIQSMICFLIKKLKKQEVQSISVGLMNSNPLIKFIQKMGFKIRPGEESSVYGYANENFIFSKEWIKGNNWFITVGDRDV